MKNKRRDNSSNYETIIEGVNAYLNLKYSDNKINDEEIYQTTINCVKAFATIFEECLSYGNFKDNWNYDEFYQHFQGPELVIKALKTNCDYRLGIDNKGLYISTDLRYNKNLRYMDDNYWKLLLSLTEFEGFEYEEYEFINKERRNEFPELFKANKSIIYRIMRKYIFDSIDKDSNYDSGTVGEFKIVAKIDADLSDTLKKFRETFKIMYKLNYELWKVTDLKNKKAIGKNLSN